MSRKVIRDLIIPIVQKLMRSYGYFSGAHQIVLKDQRLEEYLEEQLSLYYGIIGKYGECEFLEQLLKEARQINPLEFELLIEQLVNQYITLRLQLEGKEGKRTDGPPDRLKTLRHKRAESMNAR